MPTTLERGTRWDDLDVETREALDRQYLAELTAYDEPGLSEEAVQAYLRYRHERPDAAITTFEEGQISHMLHQLRDPSKVVDPVEQEEHLDFLERLGARCHLTNLQCYAVIVLALGILAVVAWLVSML